VADDQSSRAITSTGAAPIVQEQKPLPTNFMALLIKGEIPAPTLDQLKNYLEVNHRNAESLLAGYRATHEKGLLDEALTNFPNDPRVAYTAWFRTPVEPGDSSGLQARRQALDRLKQAAPDNSLANYLSAANYFKSGQPEQAVQEMLAGASKPKFDDYVQYDIQRMEEAYLAAGYPEFAAKAAAGAGALLPHLAELKQAGLSLVELANSYQQAGDTASAQAAFQMSMDLGQRLDDPNSLTLIQALVGMAIQRKGLEAMAAAAPDSDTAQALQGQLKALDQQRAGIKEMTSSLQIETWLQTAPPEDVSAYFDRVRIFGEQQAMQWLASRR
jgi:tetratricopeptide (TPR) repeat protein